MRVCHVISKLIGQKIDYHSWKELVEFSKNVKFGKDRFTNCEDTEFSKIEILYENFQKTIPKFSKGFHIKFRCLKIHIFAISLSFVK